MSGIKTITIEGTGRGQVDGTDQLVNVETAQFSDQSVDLRAINEGPVLNGQPWQPAKGKEDKGYTFELEDLLQGWSDPNGDELRVVELRISAGELIDHGDGSWTVVPDPDFHGAIELSYGVADSYGSQQGASTAIEFQAVNDAPVVQRPVSLGLSEEDTLELELHSRTTCLHFRRQQMPPPPLQGCR